MNRDDEVRLLAELAQKRGCCFWAEDELLGRALRRRVASGKLVCPYLNLYAMKEYWEGLKPEEQIRHVVIALAIRHPSWVFAGTSAAVIEGLDVPREVIDDGRIFIGDRFSSAKHTFRKLERIFVPSRETGRWWRFPGLPDLSAERYAAYPSTSALCRRLREDVIVNLTVPVRTLYDCAKRLEFKHALALFDSALRAELVDASGIRGITKGRSASKVLRLLKYADPLSENGGESLCRGNIIDMGFAVPELQHEFTDPMDARRVVRVDFMWRQPGERIIVLEFDGMQKYVDPKMTKGRMVQEVVVDQTERDGLLKRAGVTSIVHVTYSEVVSVETLRRKLIEAGVPLAAK